MSPMIPTVRARRRLHMSGPWWPRVIRGWMVTDETRLLSRRHALIFWRGWRIELLYGPQTRP